VSFWLGNKTRISAHYDYPDNIACVVAGTRRFTLFPPEQIGNLYVGPVDKTPSGQAISLVDFSNPDLERFPNFELAMQAGYQAVCEPGDAIYIPSLWWHHVESLIVQYVGELLVGSRGRLAHLAGNGATARYVDGQRFTREASCRLESPF